MRIARGPRPVRRPFRREADLRHRLAEAVYLGKARAAAGYERRLRRLLAARAASDDDLDIARRWLAEQAELAERRRGEARRSRKKLFLTLLPLVFATLLTLLLSAVLISG